MKLDSETAERLSLDAALGQLAPDVLALWEAYLSERPELAGPAGLDRRTITMARQALAEGVPAAPARPLAPRKAVWRLRAWQAMKWSAVAAAGLIIGLTAGMLLPPGSPDRPLDHVDGRQVALPTPPPDATVPAAASPEQGNDFWSAERLYRQMRSSQDRQRTARPTGRVIWTSPVKEPVIGDKL